MRRILFVLPAIALIASCAAPRQAPEPLHGGLKPTAVNISTTRHGPEKGHLLIIGGGLVPDEIWDTFAELAGGVGAKVVVITNATGGKGDYDGPAFEQIARRVGADNVVEMHLEDVLEANDPVLTAPLEQAGGVFFTGGRQWRIAEVYLNTRAHILLNALLARGGVIAGTSAGASIQGSFLWRGDTRDARYTVGDHTQGLGFMKLTAIDQHLTARGRIGDMQAFADAAPEYLCMAIDESTAALVEGDHIRVLGEARIAIYKTGSKSPLWFASGDSLDL